MTDEGNDGHFTCILGNGGEHALQVLLIVQQCFTVDGQHQIVTFLNTHFNHQRRTLPAIMTEAEIVYQNVAHHIHLTLGHALVGGVARRGDTSREKQVAQAVNHQAVHLFRHGNIERAGAGHKMSQPDAALLGYDGGGHGGGQVIDDDDENETLDYLDGSGGSSEDDLRKLRILTWAGNNVTREDGSVYSFDIYVSFPADSNVSTWQEGEKLQRYMFNMTTPFYSLASGCSQNDIMYTEGCSGGSVYPQFQLRTTLTASGVPSEVPSLTLTRTPEFYVTEYFVDLDADSDNNGYINTSANPTREKAEDEMEASVGKRITYFPDERDVPDDYMYVLAEQAFPSTRDFLLLLARQGKFYRRRAI